MIDVALELLDAAETIEALTEAATDLSPDHPAAGRLRAHAERIRDGIDQLADDPDQPTTIPLSLTARADLAEQLVPAALRLAWLVRDGQARAVRRLLADIPATHKDALAVVLAAAVDPGKTPTSLLGWTAADRPDGDLREAARSWTDAAVRTAHAAWERGERWPLVRAGETEYQRRSKARRTAAARGRRQEAGAA